MTFEKSNPILYSKDVAKRVAYYKDVLGFDDGWVWDDEATFGGVVKGNVEIFFCKENQGHPGTWLEMGFTVTQGNNMHINLEPDSREEAKRIFDALSVGGNVTMPLQDMFWGAYFGSFTDKFGINWMVNHQPKN